MVVNITDVIIREVKPFFIGKAVVASLWKSGFMGDTFIRGRKQFEKYQRSLIGDMAKLAVKDWLEEHSFSVVDYDDVRTGWRSSRKPFDLQVNGHNIEIRSSIAGQSNLGWVLQNENIIHPCDVNVKEVTVQVFFRNKSCDTAWLCGWAIGTVLGTDQYRQPRHVGTRLTDFYLMPFSDANSSTMQNLLTYL